MSQAKVRRPQTMGEEIANTISHALGALLAVVGAVPLIARAATSGSTRAVVGMSLYAGSLILLYVASTRAMHQLSFTCAGPVTPLLPFSR